MSEYDPVLTCPAVAHPSHMTEEQYVHWAIRQEFNSEWVDGTVVLHAPISGEHDCLQGLLRSLLGLHVEKYDLGRVHGPQFQIRLPRPSRRQPDVLFASKPRLQLLKPMYLDGAPDLAIEIVSPDTESRDWREKYFEYQAAGLREYWIVDPASQHVEAYTLGSDQTYVIIDEQDGKIASNIVPDWYLKPSWLWQQPRPSLLDVLTELGVR